MRKPLEFVFKLYLLVLIFQLLPMFRAFRNALSANAAINNGMFHNYFVSLHPKSEILRTIVKHKRVEL